MKTTKEISELVARPHVGHVTVHVAALASGERLGGCKPEVAHWRLGERDILIADVGEGSVSAGVPRPHCLPVDGTCLGGDHPVPRTTEDLTAGQQ